MKMTKNWNWPLIIFLAVAIGGVVWYMKREKENGMNPETTLPETT